MWASPQNESSLPWAFRFSPGQARPGRAAAGVVHHGLDFLCTLPPWGNGGGFRGGERMDTLPLPQGKPPGRMPKECERRSRSFVLLNARPTGKREKAGITVKKCERPPPVGTVCDFAPECPPRGFDALPGVPVRVRGCRAVPCPASRAAFRFWKSLPPKKGGRVRLRRSRGSRNWPEASRPRVPPLFACS